MLHAFCLVCWVLEKEKPAGFMMNGHNNNIIIISKDKHLCPSENVQLRPGTKIPCYCLLVLLSEPDISLSLV